MERGIHGEVREAFFEKVILEPILEECIGVCRWK